MRKLRIAAVGVGPYRGCRSEGHMEVIRRLSEMYELCALCDLDESRLREVGGMFGVRALYTNLDSMLRQEEPDAAYGFTIRASHPPGVSAEIRPCPRRWSRILGGCAFQQRWCALGRGRMVVSSGEKDG